MLSSLLLTLFSIAKVSFKEPLPCVSLTWFLYVLNCQKHRLVFLNPLVLLCGFLPDTHRLKLARGTVYIICNTRNRGTLGTYSNPSRFNVAYLGVVYIVANQNLSPQDSPRTLQKPPPALLLRKERSGKNYRGSSKKPTRS